MKQRLLIALILGAAVVAAVLIVQNSGSDDAQNTDDPATDHPAIGAYTTTIPAEDIATLEYLDETFEGRWDLTIEAEVYRLTREEYFNAFEDISFDGDTMVIDARPAPVGIYNCFDENGERLTEEGEAAGTYELTLDGDELTLTPINEPCPVRELFLARTWTPSP